jgi:NADH-quinone oxidoreductase subunit G
MVGKKLPFDSLAELRARLYTAHPHFQRIDEIMPGSLASVQTLAGRAGKISGEPFANAIGDFYLTNPIARASAVMAECSALHSGKLAVAAE